MSFPNIQNKTSHQSPLPNSFVKKNSFTSEELKTIKSAKEHLAKKVFDKPLDVRRLALVHGETSIKGSEFEGGDVYQSIEAWKTMLKSWKDGMSDIDIGLNAKEIDRLLEAFTATSNTKIGLNAKEIDRLMKAFTATSNTKENSHIAYQMAGETLFNYIADQLEKNNFIAIPIRYAGSGRGGGHVFGAIFEKDAEGKIRCTLVDKGEACGMHPMLTHTGKAKRSYRFFPILIKDDFFKKTEEWSVGKEFFHRLLRYGIPPDLNEAPYSSEEIYDLFFQIGLVEEEKVEDFKEEDAVTPQRSGTCSEMFSRLLLRDLLTRNSSDNLEEAYNKYRRIIFAEKFSTLHEACMAPLGVAPINLMQQCVDDFALSVEKHYSEGRINRAEYLRSYALIELAREKIEIDALAKAEGPVKLPDLSIESQPLARIDNIPVFEFNVPSEIKNSVDNPVDISKPDPKELLISLQNCIKACHKDTVPKRAFYTAYHMIQNLPIPGGVEDGYWDLVPEEEIQDVLDHLKELTEIVCKNAEQCPIQGIRGAYYPAILLLTMSGLAITDRLARRIPALAFENYCINVNFQRFDAFHKKLFFQLGSDSKRFAEARNYLASKSQGKKALFDFDSCDNFDEIVQDIVAQKPISVDKEPVADHLLYLKKLASNFKIKGLDRDPSIRYMQLLCYQSSIVTPISETSVNTSQTYDNKMLPKAYRALEFFAFQIKHLNRATTLIKEFEIIPGFWGEAKRIRKVGQPISYTTEIHEPEFDKIRMRDQEKLRLDRFRETKKALNDLQTTNGLENQIFSKNIKPEEEIPVFVLRDFQKMRLKGKLTIPAIVQWCKENPEYAKNPDLQSLVELFTLQGTTLRDKAIEEPLVIENFRRLIDEKVSENLIPAKFNQALFWINFAFHIETHVAEVSGSQSKIYYERIAKLKSHLEGLQRAVLSSGWMTRDDKNLFLHDIAACQAYLSSFPFPKEKLSEDAACEIISRRCIQAICSPPQSRLPHWYLEEIHSQFYAHQTEIRESLKNADTLTKAVSPILKKLGLEDQLNTAAIEYAFPMISINLKENTISIDLLEGIVRKNGALIRIGKWPNWIRANDRSLAKALGNNLSDITTPTENSIVAVDGSFRIFKEKSSFLIQKLISFNDQTQYYQYEDELPTIMLPSVLLSGGKTCWLSTKLPQHYLIFNSDNTPYAHIEIDDSGQYQVIRLVKPQLFDPKTKQPIKETLVELPKDSPWYQFLKQIAPIYSILVWGNRSDEKTKITRLEFPNFENLSFTVSEENDAAFAFCDQLQGYFLSSEQGEKSLNFLPGALTLEKKDEPDKKYLLLPAAQLNSRPVVETKPSLHKEGRDEFLNEEPKMFLYEIAKDGTYVSNSQTAMLYLIYVLKKQGNYVEANRYIEQFQHTHFFNLLDTAIIKLLLAEDNTPQAAGLSMKIGLLFIENESLSLKGKKEGGNVFHDLPSHFENYLHYTANHEAKHVPYYLRINDKQTKRLFKFLTREGNAGLGFTGHLIWNAVQSQKAAKKLNTEHKQSIRADYNVRFFFDKRVQKDSKDLIAFERSFKDRLDKFKFEVDPSKIQTEESGDFKVKKVPIGARIEAKEIAAKFLYLFEEARSCSKEFEPFDLKLSQMYRLHKDSDLLFILYLVRSHPEKFKDINLPLKNSELSDFQINLRGLIRNQPEKFKDINLPLKNSELSAFKDELLKGILNVLGEVKRQTPGYEHKPLPEKVIPVTADLKNIPLTRFLPQAPPAKKSFQINAAPGDKPLRPLKPILQRFFKKSGPEVLSAEQKPFVLKQSNLPKDQPLANRLTEDLSSAHSQVNENKIYAKYAFKAAASVADLKDTLEKEISEKQAVLAKLKADIERVANFPSGVDLESLDAHELDVIRHKMRIQGKQAAVLTLENDIMLAVLEKDAAKLQKLNPFLTQEMCDDLFRQTIEYELKGSYLDQCQEALKLVNEGYRAKDDLALRDSKLTQAAEILDKKRDYNPFLYPELIFYEYSTGMMLRNEPNQAALLKEIFSLIFDNPPTAENRDLLRKLFFEFQAGGGKTKVISAIVAYKAIAEGKKPVFFSLPDLFDITKKDLQSSLNTALKRKTRTIDIGLDTVLDVRDLKEFYKNCRRSMGSCDVMKPETFHALHLKYQEALYEKNVDKVRFLSKIMDFYEKEGIFLIDESHRNADSLLQANYAFGKPFPIPEDQRNFLIKCLYKLIGISEPKLTLADGRDVAEVIGLRQNRQAFLLPEQKKEILEVLAKSFLDDPALDIKEEDRETFFKYLIDLKLQPPEWLTERQNSGTKELQNQAQLIALLRGMVTILLPHTLSLSGLMDYGPSLRNGDEVEAPRKQMKPSECKFELPDIAAVLSIQGRLQRGLITPAEMQKALTLLKDEMVQEAKIYKSLEKTPTAKAFLEWQKEASHKIPLDVISAEDLMSIHFLNKMIKTIGREPKIIELYLTNLVLPKIDIFPFKFTSTAADLTGGCLSPVLFSATLGSAEQYPYLANPDTNFKEDTAFQADVIQRACLPHNREMISIMPSTPYQFFADVFAKNPRAFEKIDGLINLGGLCKEYPNEMWAKQLMQFVQDHNIPIEAALFFKEESQREGELPEKAMYLLLRGQKVPIRLESTDVKKELSKLGISDKRVFKIYSPSDTTGTDLVLASDAKMLLTLGEGVTLSYLIQAIMRMRQFLKSPIDPETAQSILWVIPENLKEVIRKSLKLESDVELTPEHCFNWAILQEADRQQKSIVMRALQEIQFVIRNRVKQELRAELKDPNKQIEIFHNHTNAFLMDLGRDPFSSYALGAKETDSAKVLTEQAESFARRANLPLEKHPNEKNRIDEIIQQTKRLVDKIAAKAAEDLSANAFQHQQQERRQEAKQEQQAIAEQQAQNLTALKGKKPLEPLKYAAETLSLSSKGLLKNASPDHLPAKVLFGTKVFRSEVAVGKNVFETLERSPLEKETIKIDRYSFYPLLLVKPIDYFLVVDEEVAGESVKKALALSVDDAASYQEQLTKGEFGGSNKRKAILFSSNGFVTQNGKGECGLSQNELEALEKSPWFKDVLFDINLMNGRIFDEQKMVEVIREQPNQVKSLWEKIAKTHVDQEAIQHVLMWHLTKKAEQQGLNAEPEVEIPIPDSSTKEVPQPAPVKPPVASAPTQEAPSQPAPIKPLVAPVETPSQPAPVKPPVAPAPTQEAPSQPAPVKPLVAPVETPSQPAPVKPPVEPMVAPSILSPSLPSINSTMDPSAISEPSISKPFPHSPSTGTTPFKAKPLTPWQSFKSLWKQKSWVKLVTIFTLGLAIPFFLLNAKQKQK